MSERYLHFSQPTTGDISPVPVPYRRAGPSTMHSVIAHPTAVSPSTPVAVPSFAQAITSDFTPEVAPDLTTVALLVVTSASFRSSATNTVDNCRVFLLAAGFLNTRRFFACLHPGPDVQVI